MRLAALAIALAAVACGKSTSTPREQAGSAQPVAAATDHASDGQLVVTSSAAQLPGTLWFIADGALAHVSRGQLTTELADVGAPVYPSRFALPDGRLVGIASRGDGVAGGEQLVLIGPGTQITRIGEAATAVRDPAVDPAGAWIVYEAKTTGASELWRLDPATNETTKIVSTPQGDFKPAVLATDAIVFVSSRDGDSEIYRGRIDGTRVTRLTAFHRDDWDPTPSPDLATIAFTSDREGRPRIFLMAPDGTHQRRLTARAGADIDEAMPVWSPDGSQLAYLTEGPGRSQLWLRDVASGRERVLTPEGARDEDPAFSPDGAWIAVARTPQGARRSALWVIPTAGGAALEITRGAEVRLPRWR